MIDALKKSAVPILTPSYINGFRTVGDVQVPHIRISHYRPGYRTANCRWSITQHRPSCLFCVCEVCTVFSHIHKFVLVWVVLWGWFLRVWKFALGWGYSARVWVLCGVEWLRAAFFQDKLLFVLDRTELPLQLSGLSSTCRWLVPFLLSELFLRVEVNSIIVISL